MDVKKKMRKKEIALLEANKKELSKEKGSTFYRLK